MRAIEAIRSSVTMADIYAALGFEFDAALLSRGGKMRCQLHGPDNHPSAYYYPDKKRVHCFSCNFDGDVLDVTQKVLALPDMQSTIHWLLRKFPGIEFEPMSVEAAVPQRFQREYEDIVREQLLNTVADRVWDRIDTVQEQQPHVCKDLLFSFARFRQWAATAALDSIIAEANKLLETKA